MNFNSFQITEDGKRPFILKMKGIVVLFWRDGPPPLLLSLEIYSEISVSCLREVTTSQSHPFVGYPTRGPCALSAIHHCLKHSGFTLYSSKEEMTKGRYPCSQLFQRGFQHLLLSPKSLHLKQSSFQAGSDGVGSLTCMIFKFGKIDAKASL